MGASHVACTRIATTTDGVLLLKGSDKVIELRRLLYCLLCGACSRLRWQLPLRESGHLLRHLGTWLLHHHLCLHHHLHLCLHHHLHLRQLLRTHLLHLLWGHCHHCWHGPRHHLRRLAGLHLRHHPRLLHLHGESRTRHARPLRHPRRCFTELVQRAKV